MIDLGRWLDEDFRIPGERANVPEQSGLEPDGDD